jgi:frataxin-like iron-binding protein CyaY
MIFLKFLILRTFFKKRVKHKKMETATKKVSENTAPEKDTVDVKPEDKDWDPSLMDETITIVTNDKRQFIIPKKAALLSKTLASMLEGDQEMLGIQNEIELSLVSGECMDVVVRYMKFKLAEQVRLSDPTQKPERFSVPKKIIFEMINVSRFLDM